MGQGCSVMMIEQDKNKTTPWSRQSTDENKIIVQSTKLTKHLPVSEQVSDCCVFTSYSQSPVFLPCSRWMFTRKPEHRSPALWLYPAEQNCVSLNLPSNHWTSPHLYSEHPLTSSTETPRFSVAWLQTQLYLTSHMFSVVFCWRLQHHVSWQIKLCN